MLAMLAWFTRLSSRGSCRSRATAVTPSMAPTQESHLQIRVRCSYNTNSKLYLRMIIPTRAWSRKGNLDNFKYTSYVTFCKMSYTYKRYLKLSKLPFLGHDPIMLSSVCSTSRLSLDRVAVRRWPFLWRTFCTAVRMSRSRARWGPGTCACMIIGATTGWHIRLFSRFCWHQNKSSALI